MLVRKDDDFYLYVTVKIVQAPPPGRRKSGVGEDESCVIVHMEKNKNRRE